MSSPSEILRKLHSAIENGQVELATQGIGEALAAGIDPLVVLEDGLMGGASALGEAFEIGKVFLPELMLGGRALKSAMAVLTPVLQARRGGHLPATPARVLMATVQTDIHDIGKNAVGAMLTASGLEVVDLGVDVPARTIVDRAVEDNVRMIGVSALLTTSLPYMRDLMDLVVSKGLRQNFKVVAAVTPDYAALIGSDGTAANAAQAAILAKRLLIPRPEKQGGS